MFNGYFVVLLFIILLGLSIGSFINVLIYRLPRGISILRPPSSCRSCGRRLGSAELIPLLGYLALRGRCLKCGALISPRYPLVELGTALLFTAIYLSFGLTITGLGYMLLTTILITVSLIDLDHRIIPNTLVAFGLGGGLLTYLPGFAAAWFNLPEIFVPARPFPDALAGAALGGLLLLIIILVSRGGMGGGDMKLMTLIGFYAGLQGTAIVLFVAFTSGALIGLALIAARRLTRKEALPFGPFLSAAALIEIFGGHLIWSWYINLLS